VKRRAFLKAAAAGFVATATQLPQRSAALSRRTRKVVVLGIDGLDPRLLRLFIDGGHLPNCRKLVAQGGLRPLATTTPPLSPVAWSTFITGLSPAQHGIFDFIHRDPTTLASQFSMSRAVAAPRVANVGSWVIPLSSGRFELLRRGRPFWQVLEERGVPTTIFRIPVNFPPAPSPGRSLSGMGTPDIVGTSGTFSFYTEDPSELRFGVRGGEAYRVTVRNNRVVGSLMGPRNPLRRTSPAFNISADDPSQHPRMAIDFSASLDPTEPVVKFVIQNSEFILRQGEWSDWLTLRFVVGAVLTVATATARVYLQSVRPFRLYVSPLQIDPAKPVAPISTPPWWSQELVEHLGYFYTQELPEETKAYSAGVFNGDEFWSQLLFVYEEQLRAFQYLVSRFKEGLLFFYLSGIDQGCHMLWRFMDQQHPGYLYNNRLQDGIRNLYGRMDAVIGQAMRTLDDSTTLIVMSDHGFAGFYRAVALNAWLRRQGYLTTTADTHGQLFLERVDWKRTSAYALGLNGLYVNTRGRERDGSVEPKEAEEIARRLRHELLRMRDAENAQAPVISAYLTKELYVGADPLRAPDLIVGYGQGYRVSWESALGGFDDALIKRNSDPWSGDHATDHRLVPGVLVSNRRITENQPRLADLTATMFGEFGLPVPREIDGRPILG
jgi:predicted AlkP superfamily phosphohydrolase/phosphomutase